jgi:hypothetical protein
MFGGVSTGSLEAAAMTIGTLISPGRLRNNVIHNAKDNQIHVR